MGRRKAEQTPQRRRWLFWSGLVLVLTGLAMLGYVGWQMFVTNWLSQREHSAIIEQLERAWDEDETSAGGTVEVDSGRAAGILTIPRFGDDYAVPILEGVDDASLAAGVGHFPESSAAGKKGNYALAAHRVTHGEPFRQMPELEPGDEVVVTTEDRVFTYVLDTGGDDLTVPFTEGWVVDPRPVNPDKGEPTADLGQKKLITLTTCSELFHTDGRLIAFGHLVSSEPRVP